MKENVSKLFIIVNKRLDKSRFIMFPVCLSLILFPLQSYLQSYVDRKAISYKECTVRKDKVPKIDGYKFFFFLYFFFNADF